MKLLCKKIKSHTCLEILQSTNDAKRAWRLVPELFGILKMSKKEEVNQKWYPKVSNCSVFRKTLVGKRKSSTRASSIHNWQVLSATLGHCYSQYYLSITELNFWQFKLVKEQSLILCNSKFTAKKERRWNIHPPFVVSVAALIMNSGAPWVRKIGY